jgi:hypothetical protein
MTSFRRFAFVTHVSQNWNQLVQELYQWQQLGRALENEVNML